MAQVKKSDRTLVNLKMDNYLLTLARKNARAKGLTLSAYIRRSVFAQLIRDARDDGQTEAFKVLEKVEELMPCSKVDDLEVD